MSTTSNQKHETIDNGIKIEGAVLSTKAETILLLKQLKDDIASITLTLSELKVDQKIVLQRLDILDKMSPSVPIAPKRTIKTVESSKPEDTIKVSNSSTSKKEKTKVTKKTETENKKTKEVQEEKISNAMGFFKIIICKNDYLNLRKTYSDKIDSILSDTKQASKLKKLENKDKYWPSIGHLVWKLCSDEDRKHIAELYKIWKEKNEKSKDNDQLEEDENKEHEENEEDEDNDSNDDD